MHTRAEFRLLLLFNALLIPAAMFVATYDALLLPAPLQAWLASRSNLLLSPLQSLASTIAFAAFISICIGLLGMFFFWRWARWLTLWGTVLVYVPMPLSGSAVLSAWAYTLDAVAAILWGAMLAAAYWSPIAAQFSPDSSHRGGAGRAPWRRRAAQPVEAAPAPADSPAQPPMSATVVPRAAGEVADVTVSDVTR